MLGDRAGRTLILGEQAGRYLGLERMRMGQAERATWSEAEDRDRDRQGESCISNVRLSLHISV
jgi:hypothetical protein